MGSEADSMRRRFLDAIGLSVVLASACESASTKTGGSSSSQLSSTSASASASTSASASGSASTKTGGSSSSQLASTSSATRQCLARWCTGARRPTDIAADPPYERCATTSLSMSGQGALDRERTKLVGTVECCYAVAHSCDPGGPPPGRVLSGRGRPVTAVGVRRADWAREISLNWDDLPSSTGGRAITPSTTRAVADHFLRAAGFEHASIASFARSALELLAVGAPAELIRDSHAAAMDEIEHARACYGIASRFAAQSLGPGALPVMALDDLRTELTDVAISTWLEACLPETIGAMLAREASRRTSIPVLRDTLARIADDEARHAELAWRVVAWACATADGSVARALAARYERWLACAERRPTSDQSRDDLEPYGVLSRETRDAVTRAALEYVVRPCTVRILSSSQVQLRARA